MSNNNSNSSEKIGLFGLMFLIFMTLKLIGLFEPRVTAPLWGGFALILVLYF